VVCIEEGSFKGKAVERGSLWKVSEQKPVSGVFE